MTSFIVCIPAAGSGTRMNSPVPKQYLPLCGRAVLLHTLDVFERMDSCLRIIIATDDQERLSALLATRTWATPIHIVEGGAQRQHSVANALAAVDDDEAVVLVHDAARPCVRAEDVQAVADSAAEHGAALLAVAARDTLKEVRDGVVLRTVDRSVMWQAQTPQGARAALLREAFAQADPSMTATDDAALIEALGQPVVVVEGSYDNMKITATTDLPLAEALLRAAGRGDCA